MAFWNKFPFTNFHEMNLDWIISTMKDLLSGYNDFTADIAKRGIVIMKNGELTLSAKQAWCIAYQVVNNIEVYKVAMNDYINEVID